MARLFALARRRHIDCVEAVKGGLHPAAIRERGTPPSLVGWIVEIRADNLAERHCTVTDGFTGTGGASSGAIPGRYKMKRPPAPENKPRMTGCCARMFFW